MVESAEKIKQWKVRDANKATVKKIKVFATVNGMTVGAALDKIVEMSKI